MGFSRQEYWTAGPGAYPAVGERAVPGRADQHPVHGARLRQDPTQQPRAQYAPGQEPPPAGEPAAGRASRQDLLNLIQVGQTCHIEDYTFL